jgi:hypothetical protein
MARMRGSRSRHVVPRRPGAWPASLSGDLARLELEVAEVDQLRAVWAHVAGAARVTTLDVVVRSWKPPVPGWLGSPGALPGMLERSVVVSGDGSVRVRVVTADPVDAGRAVAAVLGALAPHRHDDGPGTSEVAVAAPLGGAGGWLAPRATDVLRPDQHHDEHVRRTDLVVSRRGGGVPTDDVGARQRLELGRTWLAPVTQDGTRRWTTRVVDSTVHNPVGRAMSGEGATIAQDPSGRLVVASRSVTHTVEGVLPDSADLRALAPIAHATVLEDVELPRHLPALLALMAGGMPLGVAPRPVPPDVPPAVLAQWMSIRTDGDLATWASSVQQRRAVLRDHSVESVLRRVQSLDGDLPAAPTVSVVLSTMRPDRLSRIVSMVAGFAYPHVQLVIGVHGDGLDAAAATKALQRHGRGIDSVVLHRSSSTAFGAVLADLTARADGALVTKVDDDDEYGEQHLWDLVLARDYSGAAVVGKPPEFVYLEGLDITVRRSGYRVERYGPFVAGGTMLMSRADLDAVGGWRPVARSVDRGVLDRVRRSGGLVYSTHGLGYLYVRHAEGHTWDPGLDHFLRKNVAQWPGRPRDLDRMTF